jgi:hypothetical protein
MAIILSGGNAKEDLSSLRHRLLLKKAKTGANIISPEKLPPTADATKFHSLRSYLQIKEWMGEALNPSDFGWKEEMGEYVPIMAIVPAAPQSLLEVVSCKCKTHCRSANCSCRRYGLLCTLACGSCQDSLCENPYTHQDTIEDDDDELELEGQ